MFSILTTQLRLLALATVTAVGLLTRCRRPDSSSASRHPDHGSFTTEAVIVTALLASAAITIFAIIIAKITERANSITL